MYQYLFSGQILLLVIIVLVVKYIVHINQLEFLEEYPLVAALVTTNAFILGFLINGVFPDYKNAERIPFTLRSQLSQLRLDLLQYGVSEKKSNEYILLATNCIIDWFYKRARFPQVIDTLLQFKNVFPKEKSKVKEIFVEQTTKIQDTLTQAYHTRNTRFIQTGYIIVDITTFLAVTGLIFLHTDHILESFFYTGVFSFLLIFMVTLLRDLDNPFSHYTKNKIEEVSLSPLYDLRDELKKV